MAQVFPRSGPESHNGGTEIGVRNSGALWSLQGTPLRPRYKFWVEGGARGLPAVWHLQDNPVPPKERRIHRKKLPNARALPQSSVPRNQAEMGRACAAYSDEEAQGSPLI